MSPAASFYDLPPNHRHDAGGIAWASVIAILFAVIATISFAVDQSVTLSGLPAPASVDSTGH